MKILRRQTENDGKMRSHVKLKRLQIIVCDLLVITRLNPYLNVVQISQTLNNQQGVAQPFTQIAMNDRALLDYQFDSCSYL